MHEERLQDHRVRATPDADRGQLKDIQQQLISAWIHRDRSALERLLAEEWSVTHCRDGRWQVVAYHASRIAATAGPNEPKR